MATQQLDVNVRLPLWAITSKGQELKKNIDVVLKNVECLTWVEECHGFHRMFEPIDSELEYKIREFYDNLSLEDAENLLVDYLDIDEKITDFKEDV
jgi:hypothetical protein